MANAKTLFGKTRVAGKLGWTDILAYAYLMFGVVLM